MKSTLVLFSVVLLLSFIQVQAIEDSANLITQVIEDPSIADTLTDSQLAMAFRDLRYMHTYEEYNSVLKAASDSTLMRVISSDPTIVDFSFGDEVFRRLHKNPQLLEEHSSTHYNLLYGYYGQLLGDFPQSIQIASVSEDSVHLRNPDGSPGIRLGIGDKYPMIYSMKISPEGSLLSPDGSKITSGAILSHPEGAALTGGNIELPDGGTLSSEHPIVLGVEAGMKKGTSIEHFNSEGVLQGKFSGEAFYYDGLYLSSGTEYSFFSEGKQTENFQVFEETLIFSDRNCFESTKPCISIQDSETGREMTVAAIRKSLVVEQSGSSLKRLRVGAISPGQAIIIRRDDSAVQITAEDILFDGALADLPYELQAQAPLSPAEVAVLEENQATTLKELNQVEAELQRMIDNPPKTPSVFSFKETKERYERYQQVLADLREKKQVLEEELSQLRQAPREKTITLKDGILLGCEEDSCVTFGKIATRFEPTPAYRAIQRNTEASFGVTGIRAVFAIDEPFLPHEAALREDLTVAAQRVDIDPELLMATYFQEGGILEALNNNYDPSEVIDTFAAVGIDTLVLDKERLVEKGYLDEEFFGRVQVYTTLENEAGLRVPVAKLTRKDAMLGMAALMRDKNDAVVSVRNQHTNTNLYSQLSREEQWWIQYAAYNWGQGNVQRLLSGSSEYGSGGNEPMRSIADLRAFIYKFKGTKIQQQGGASSSVHFNAGRVVGGACLFAEALYTTPERRCDSLASTQLASN